MTAVSLFHRGDVVRVRLDPVEGSEQSGQRPGLVISSDVINDYSPVILVAVMTSRKTEKIFPFETLIEPPKGGLSQRSKVSLMQPRTLDKRRVVGRDGVVGESLMERVDDVALRIAVGLTRL